MQNSAGPWPLRPPVSPAILKEKIKKSKTSCICFIGLAKCYINFSRRRMEKNGEYMHKKVLQQIYIRKKYIQNIQKYMQK